MEIYKTLADSYDQLVKDEDATRQWADFTCRYLKHGKLLELACGSGEITLALAERGFEITAGDLSEEMLKAAKQKASAALIQFLPLDMRCFDLAEQFDGVICYCDSVNYLQDETELAAFFACVKKHLKPGGWFLFDMHSTDRLKEFEEEYIEEGELDNQVQYQWTIQSDEDWIHHHFTFWQKDGSVKQEMHRQRVFDAARIEQMLKEEGFDLEFWTDFERKGITAGEKIFVAAKKIK